MFVYITFGNVTSRTNVALPDTFSDGDIVVTETKRTFAGNPADIAALNYFTSTFTTDPNFKNCSPEDLTIIEDITLSEADVFSVLHNLDINKAQGPDGIPARLLKETARQIAPSLTVLFNKSLSTGV